MDPFRFDAWTRAFGARLSRRTALGTLPALLGLGIATDAAAAKCSKRKPCKPCRRCKKGTCKPVKDGKPCAGGTCRGGRCVGGCTPSCAGKQCGDDGCGGSCGTCPGGQSCDVGACECPIATPYQCADSITCRECCGDAECPSNQTCRQHRCTSSEPPCPSATPLRCPGSTVCRECCADPDCAEGRTCQQGTCACPSGTRFCSFVGQCGRCCDNRDCCGRLVCDATEQTCQADRTCGCGSGRFLCNETCVDLQNDDNNCGRCGNVCTGESDIGEGGICISGQCQRCKTTGRCAPQCCRGLVCGGTSGICVRS
jgi:hypothetical protein